MSFRFNLAPLRHGAGGGAVPSAESCEQSSHGWPRQRPRAVGGSQRRGLFIHHPRVFSFIIFIIIFIIIIIIFIIIIIIIIIIFIIIIIIITFT